MNIRILICAAAYLIMPEVMQEAWSAPAPGKPGYKNAQQQESLRISQILKPITDSHWNEIAGQRTAQKYRVERGDTLSGISQRLFGDPRYWPKIWALNNGKITNPHHLEPGNQVNFFPGSGTSLPSFGVERGGTQVAQAESDTFTDYGTSSGGRSQEWKHLPHQNWEGIDTALPAGVDPQGFDRRNKITFTKSTGFELPSFPTRDKLPLLGEVTAGRLPGSFLSDTDVVYIRPKDGELKIGEVYSLTQDPFQLKNEKETRTGYSYLNLGQVEVIGNKEAEENSEKFTLWIGKLKNVSAPIPRGTSVIARIPRATDPSPILGPSPMAAQLMVDRNVTSTFATAQHKYVYVDRGTQDGITPGMVFRAYQHTDPNTEKKIMDSDFVYNADFIVVRTSEDYSLALAMSSYDIVQDGAEVMLLTSAEGISAPPPQPISEAPAAEPIPEDTFDAELPAAEPPAPAPQPAPPASVESDPSLDPMDPGAKMSPEEEKELQQLEDWKSEGSPAPEPAPTPEASPVDLAPAEPAAPAEDSSTQELIEGDLSEDFFDTDTPGTSSF